MTTYIVMWDMTGLESVISADDLDSQDTFRRLKGEKSSALANTLHMMMLRARMNSQRYYEIYSINTTENIDDEGIRKAFDENPQGMADLIRRRGIKIYSDRASEKQQVIV